MVSNERLVLDAFQNLVNLPAHQNQWVCDETIFRLLSAMYRSLARTFKFERRGLNRALSKHATLSHSANPTGLHLKIFMSKFPYNGERRNVSYYYFHTSGSLPADPTNASECHDNHAESYNMRQNQICVAAAERSQQENDSVGQQIGHEIDEREPERLRTPSRGSVSDERAREVTPAKDT